MKGQELLELMQRACRRVHYVGTPENGIIIGLEQEGRLFAVHNGEVLNRVVVDSILGRSTKSGYLNPGGDGLWPAPEGTCFGYEYATGQWRVPPAITGSVWNVLDSSTNQCTIRAEIDLINSRQLGIPTEFERTISYKKTDRGLIQDVTETIRYLGSRPLNPDEFLLAPWSLCQFDTVEGSTVVFPMPKDPSDLWDLYEPSESRRTIKDDLCIVNAITPFRFQLGLGKSVPWIEYRYPGHFNVRRTVVEDLPSTNYVDIADIAPDLPPSNHATKLSLYCDPSGFMEIEGCGGAQKQLSQNDSISVHLLTEYF